MSGKFIDYLIMVLVVLVVVAVCGQIDINREKCQLARGSLRLFCELISFYFFLVFLFLKLYKRSSKVSDCSDVLETTRLTGYV